jgi:Zn-dependent protease with chaperone function
MERSRYVDLERRLERLAVESPRAYKARALLLALAGYGFLAFIMGIVVVGMAFAFGFTSGGERIPFLWRCVFGLVGVLIVTARAMWVRIERPTGLRLMRADAPRLFDEVEHIRRAVGAPRVHEVLVTDAYNASMSQFPRLGPFGWYRNYLTVGYPLLATLTADEARAVLAHEFAHLSRDHSRFTGWIYRVRRTWFQMAAALHGGQQAGISLFSLFANWYTPYFGAYSMVLARRHEFEADRLAASVVGAEAIVDALIALRLRGRALQADFWDVVSGEADKTPDVPADVYVRLTASATHAIGDERATTWLSEELRAPTEFGDTHPALADRIRALVGDPTSALVRANRAAADRAGRTAAAEYLGASVDRIAAQLSQEWVGAAADSWRERYEYHTKASHALEELQGDPNLPETTDSLWSIAQLTRDVHGLDAMLPALERVLARDREHVPARFALGRLLLHRGDESGIGHVEFAMARDHEAVLPGCEIVRDFLIRAGRGEDAERYVARSWAQMDTYQAGMQERTQLTGKDRFIPHTLDDAAVAHILRQLAGRARLKRAYLVDKVVRHIPEEPPHILFLVPAVPLWAWLWPAKEAQICNELLAGLDLPQGTWAFVLDTERAHYRSVAAKVPGAEVYRRPKRRERGSRRTQPHRAPTPTRPSQSVA